MDPFLAETNPCILGGWLKCDFPARSVAVCYLLMVVLCIFIVCLTFPAVFVSGWAPLAHTHLGLALPTSDCPRLVTQRWPREGRICQDSAKAHSSVADTWGLLSDRTFQNSQIKPPKLCWSIYIHMNKLGLKVVIFKLVEQAGGEV